MHIDHTKGLLTSDLRDTVQVLLSSSRQMRQEFEASLSSIPLHPYERLKYQYFLPEEEFLNLEDVRVPSNFCPYTCSRELCSISLEFNKNMLAQVSALSCSDIKQECNAFSTLSGNAFVQDYDKTKNHINFLEMVRNIPIEMVNQNPKQVAQKILSQYITFFK